MKPLAFESRRPAVPALVALQSQLQALRDVVESLDSRAYRATPSRVSGSIGEHVRHVVDHARALLTAASREPMTYDARKRGTSIETDPVQAAVALDGVCADLESIARLPQAVPIRLAMVLEPGRLPARIVTTLERETAYVLQHTIHHSALVAVLVEAQRGTVPERFGLAPCTPARH